MQNELVKYTFAKPTKNINLPSQVRIKAKQNVLTSCKY
jgi:hypothetical protein